MTKKEIAERLAYLEGEIQAERISYGEIAELVSLAEYIPEDNVLLREWAGIPEFEETKCEWCDRTDTRNTGGNIYCCPEHDKEPG